MPSSIRGSTLAAYWPGRRPWARTPAPGGWLGYIAVAAMAVVIIVGLIHGQSRPELFNLAIVMAIAAVPTGMPTVLTTLLSIGMQALAAAA